MKEVYRVCWDECQRTLLQGQIRQLRQGKDIMFDTLTRSWQLVKYSWAFLRRNKSFIWFPIFSSIAALIASIALLLPAGVIFGVMSGGRSGDDGSPLGFIFVFFFYMVVYTISIYFNVALTGAVFKELDGGTATVQEGLAIANSKIGLILQYAAISATVGVVLNAVRERGGLIGNIAASLFGMAWNLVTFFVVPLLVLEDKSVIDLIRDSGRMLKATFGEQVVGGFGVGSVIGLMTLGIIIVGILLTVLLSGISTLLMGIVIVLTVVSVVVISLIGSTLSSIYRVLVFRYAQTGTVPSDMDISLLQGAFKEKKKR